MDLLGVITAETLYHAQVWEYTPGIYVILKLYKKGHYNLCLMIRQVLSLLEKCNYTTLHIMYIKAIASEVF